MTQEEHKNALLDWIAPQESMYSDTDDYALANALYAFSETGLFGDLSIDNTTAVRVWAIVSTIRSNGFPERLRM